MLKRNIKWLYKREKKERAGKLNGKEFAAILGVKPDTYRSWTDIRGIQPGYDPLIQMAAIAMSEIKNFLHLDLSLPENKVIPTQKEIFWSRYNSAGVRDRREIDFILGQNN